MRICFWTKFLRGSVFVLTVLIIICHVIMQKSYLKRKYRLVLSKEVKRKLWLTLPYRLRLRIEHSSYVANVLTKHWNLIDVKFLPRMKHLWYRNLARFYPEIIKLNNPYEPFINAPVSDKEAEVRINKFLSRFNA